MSRSRPLVPTERVEGSLHKQNSRSPHELGARPRTGPQRRPKKRKALLDGQANCTAARSQVVHGEHLAEGGGSRSHRLHPLLSGGRLDKPPTPMLSFIDMLEAVLLSVRAVAIRSALPACVPEPEAPCQWVCSARGGWHNNKESQATGSAVNTRR